MLVVTDKPTISLSFIYLFFVFLMTEIDLKPQLLGEPFILASLISLLKLDLGLSSSLAV